MTRPASEFLPLKNDAVLILLVVAARPCHGYAIMREVEARSDGAVVLQTGALYRELKRLLGDGLIEECAAPRDAESDDDRRRYYRATNLGRSVLSAEADRMAALVRAARHVTAAKTRLAHTI